MMRIEYENHAFLPGGVLLLWVTESGPPPRLSLLERWMGRRALSRGAERRCYAFERDIGRWLDDAKNVVLATDPRHMRLTELMVAQKIQAAVDTYVGL